MPTECGPRTEKYFYRSQSYNSAELADLVTYVIALPYRPNRYRLPDGELTRGAGARKGDLRAHQDTSAASRFRRRTSAATATAARSTPTPSYSMSAPASRPTARRWWMCRSLPNVAYSAPYLHDGSAQTLEEIWTVFNPHDTHGVTNDLTERRTERPDRVPEDPMKSRAYILASLTVGMRRRFGRFAATPGHAALSAGRTSPPPRPAGQPCVQRAGGRRPHLGGNGERPRAVRRRQVEGVHDRADGLAHRAVLSLALDKRTGDVWAAHHGRT